MPLEPRLIRLMDTTLRDGEQTQGVAFTPTEKLIVAKELLHALRVDRIEIASAYVSQGEKEAVTAVNRWAETEGLAEKIEVLGFIDHTRSVDWVVDTGGHVINLLTKGSEKHCREQLRKTLAQHLEEIKRTVDYAQSKGLKVNVALEDWSNGFRDNREYVFELIDNLQPLGLGHFMLPDTLGVLSPEEVFDSLSVMYQRYPTILFDFHPHNDYGLATANVMAAVRAGVSDIHCTINCLGERAGNVSLAEVAVVLRDKMAMLTSIDESHLMRISKMVEGYSGKRIADNAPIVGADVFTQTAGVHADGDRKGRLYQSKLQPERFSRSRSYALGKLSGKASLKINLEKLDIALSEPDQQKVLARIVALGDTKQNVTPEVLHAIIADVLKKE